MDNRTNILPIMSPLKRAKAKVVNELQLNGFATVLMLDLLQCYKNDCF